VALETLPQGKLILAATARIPSLRFNLSHSNEFALFAFCLEHEVGIDIEKIKPQVAFEGIEARYFSPQERAELEALPLDLRSEGFFLCWTRKEAYVKARGEGLKVPLESFSVSLTPGKPAVLRSSDEERWRLYSLDPTAGFVGALAAEGHEHRLHLWDWRESNR
jgi:4'-phosphopantetheinyl transferase